MGFWCILLFDQCFLQFPDSIYDSVQYIVDQTGNNCESSDNENILTMIQVISDTFSIFFHALTYRPCISRVDVILLMELLSGLISSAGSSPSSAERWKWVTRMACCCCAKPWTGEHHSGSISGDTVERLECVPAELQSGSYWFQLFLSYSCKSWATKCCVGRLVSLSWSCWLLQRHVHRRFFSFFKFFIFQFASSSGT